jgi:TolB-like protein
VAWLLIEISDTIFPRLGLPDWTVTLVIVLMILGFPVALLLSWAYELTPEGVKRSDNVAPRSAAEPGPGRLFNRLILIGLVAVIAVMAGERFWSERQPSEPAQAGAQPVISLPGPGLMAAVAAPRGIAVLPFENLSEDPANAFFAGGVHEEVLTSLSLIAGLRVISRTSMLRIAESDLDVPAMAERLGVSHVLEGSVRRAGNRVRVTVQLVDADRDEHVWAENYDRDLDDIFAIQSDIARAIAGQLRIELNTGEMAALEARSTHDPRAHDLYLRALDHVRVYRGVPGFRTQIALLEQALALDPDFVQAQLRLAVAHGRIYWTGADRDGVHLERAHSLTMDIQQRWPGRTEAALAHAKYLYLVERNYEQALNACQALVSVRPNDTQVLACIVGSHKRLGHHDETLVSARRLLSVDPESSSAWFEVALALAQLGRGEEAIELAEEAGRRFPESAVLVTFLARYKLAFRADPGAALALADELDLTQAGLSARYLIAEARFAMSDVDGALAILPPLPSVYDLNTAYVDLARIEFLRYAGRGEEALAVARRAMDYLEHSGEVDFAMLSAREVAEPYALAAAIAAAAGDIDAARRWQQRALDAPEPEQDTRISRDLTLAVSDTLLGDHDTAWARAWEHRGQLPLAPGRLRALRPMFDARFGQAAAYREYMEQLN